MQQARKISSDTPTSIDDLDPHLASKIKEIIEEQWGKHLTDIKDLHVKQFYERRVLGGRISYTPVNRFVLYAQFHKAREPRRLTFSVIA